MVRDAPNRVSVNDTFQEFCAEKQAQGLQEKTIRNYEDAFHFFCNSMRNSEVFADSISDKAYRLFIAALMADEKKNDVSRQTYARNLRVFLYWLGDNDYCPKFKVKLPKAQKRIKQIYTDEEIRKLLKKPKPDCAAIEFEMWVFANLIIGTGLRLNSVRNILVRDVGTDHLTVNRTKNQMPLYLPLNADLQRILRQYIRKFGLEPDNYLFCTGSGQIYQPSSLKTLFRRYTANRGVSKTSVHLLRHTFAVRFYEKTHDIYSLSKVLGHSSVSVTQNYLQGLGAAQQTEALTQWNPVQEYGTAPRQRRGKMKKGK